MKKKKIVKKIPTAPKSRMRDKTSWHMIFNFGNLDLLAGLMFFFGGVSFGIAFALLIRR